MRAPSDKASRLLETALRRPSVVERLRGDVTRREALRALAALAKPAVIPALCPSSPPKTTPRLARLHAGETVVLGLLGCHPNGYVREAAVKELGVASDGREIPFLALRANDWVWPVAERAAELLVRRLGLGLQAYTLGIA